MNKHLAVPTWENNDFKQNTEWNVTETKPKGLKEGSGVAVMNLCM
jgi:hypothetical protein